MEMSKKALFAKSDAKLLKTYSGFLSNFFVKNNSNKKPGMLNLQHFWFLFFSFRIEILFSTMTPFFGLYTNKEG